MRRVLLALAMLLAGWLAYGPLFAWSPLTPGFQTGRTPHMTVRFRDPPGLGVPTASIETAMLQLQADVGLEFTTPATFLLCDDWPDFARFTPWLRVSHGVGAITLPIGLMTYVTPAVRNRDDLLSFLTHEASHALLYQHASIRHRLEMERQAWFVEGVGVHFGNPTAYESWSEFHSTASAAQIIRTLDPEPNGAPRGAGGVRVSYSAYGYFVGHLIQQFGQERFRAFTRSYLADPLRYRDQFERAFGLSFRDAARAFSSLESEPRRSH